MSYKFDSLLIILNRIDSGKRVTADSLMEELEVSKRTVHRYITTLQTANFPIEYDRERRTYAFTGGYTLKKPNLSIEETLAFSLARKMLGNFGPAMEKSLGSIEEKLAVAHKLDLNHIVLSPDTVSPGTEHYITPIHRAIINHQRIEMALQVAFYARKSHPERGRSLLPFLLERHLVLQGLLPRGQGGKDLCTRPIQSLTVLDRHFVPLTSPRKRSARPGGFGAFIDGDPSTCPRDLR